MLKKIIAAVLIVLSSGTWGYLDYLNKQEIKAAEEMRVAMAQARAQAQERAKAAAETRARLETTILADLTTCKGAAEQAKADFVLQNQKPVRRKPGQFTLSPAAADEAARILESANTACQATYNKRLATGL
jgi:hypothetical protein